MLLIVDHYDSFSALIADYCSDLATRTVMLKTDELNTTTLDTINPTHVIVGPGPGHPSDPELLATKELIREAISRQIPLLGICLGHQLIAEIFGAKVITANHICHGIISTFLHGGSNSSDANKLFNNLPTQFKVTRYHSLLIAPETLTNTELCLSGVTSDGEIMAIHHPHLPVFGIQFHPESITTQYGKEVLANFFK